MDYIKPGKKFIKIALRLCESHLSLFKSLGVHENFYSIQYDLIKDKKINVPITTIYIQNS